MGADDETLDVENRVNTSKKSEQSTDAKKHRNGLGRRYSAKITHIWLIHDGSQIIANTGTPL